MKNIPVRNIGATQEEPDKTSNFNIRNVRDLFAGEDLVQELHRHNFFYVLALKQGAGTHEIDFVPYEVCHHVIYFMRPGQVHQHLLKMGAQGYLMSFESVFYYAHGKVSNQLLRKASNQNFYQFDATTFEKPLAALDYIFQEYAAKQEGHEEVIRANLSIFFTELIRRHDKKPSDKAALYKQEQLDKLLELLEKHIADHKQVSQYANLLSLSPYQLNAITKATLGKTCSEIINEHIMLESKRYLLATSNQVNQIAWHLGYDDASYFIRFFKKHTGYSPEAFRHKFR